MDAHQLDYRVKIVEVCVAGTSQAAHNAEVAAVQRLQEEAIIQPSTAISDFQKNSVQN
jgi:nicotinamidase-related amidase